MKKMGGVLLLALGLTFAVPSAARADMRSAYLAGQHESPQHDSTKSMKAYQRQQKNIQKKGNKAEKKARKRAKQRRQAAR